GGKVEVEGVDRLPRVHHVPEQAVVDALVPQDRIKRKVVEVLPVGAVLEREVGGAVETARLVPAQMNVVAAEGADLELEVIAGLPAVAGEGPGRTIADKIAQDGLVVPEGAVSRSGGDALSHLRRERSGAVGMRLLESSHGHGGGMGVGGECQAQHRA